METRSFGHSVPQDDSSHTISGDWEQETHPVNTSGNTCNSTD
ncbi:MAG TPA: hypothetical protein VIL99_18200 [Ignavibacteria bacterium]